MKIKEQTRAAEVSVPAIRTVGLEYRTIMADPNNSEELNVAGRAGWRVASSTMFHGQIHYTLSRELK